MSPPPPVAVRILHREAAPDAGPLERRLAADRAALAERHRRGFLAAGATDVEVVGGPPDDTPFGARLRRLAAGGRGGLVVLGSGAMALATNRDRQAFVEVAASGEVVALANHRYSADAVAVGQASVLAAVPPDLDADNALPRWLDEVAGIRVADLSARRRLAIDLDSPLDGVVLGWAAGRRTAADLDGGPLDAVEAAVAGVAEVAANRRAELLVAGRTSAATLRWLERRTASRTRAWIDERGLRAASRLALGPASGRPATRAPASALGLLLDRDGPAALGPILAGVADAAVVDSRVLLAHRCGAAESAWPSSEDRFAADLLLPGRIADAWLREVVESAANAPIPVVLAGHTLVGPGLPELVRAGRRLAAR